jgi:hypothetical protein
LSGESLPVAAEDYLSWGGVGVSATQLWQSESGRKTLVLPRAELASCELHYGSPEERPVASLLIGGVLIVPGLWHLVLYLGGNAHFGLKSLRLEVAVFLFLGVGLWLLWRSLAKRSYYLLAQGPGRPRKLVFTSKEGLPGIETFLAEARTRFSFACENQLPAGR